MKYHFWVNFSFNGDIYCRISISFKLAYVHKYSSSPSNILHLHSFHLSAAFLFFILSESITKIILLPASSTFTLIIDPVNTAASQNRRGHKANMTMNSGGAAPIQMCLWVIVRRPTRSRIRVFHFEDNHPLETQERERERERERKQNQNPVCRQASPSCSVLRGERTHGF